MILLHNDVHHAEQQPFYWLKEWCRLGPVSRRAIGISRTRTVYLALLVSQFVTLKRVVSL